MRTEYCEFRGQVKEVRWPDDQTWVKLWNVVVYADKRYPSYSEWIVPGTVDMDIV